MIGAIALLALWGITPENGAIVAYPVAAIVVTLVLFAITLTWLEDGDLPYFEVGFFFTIIVSLYAVYALVTALLSDLRYGPLSDLRLWLMKPTPEELARAGWMHVALVATFAVSYLLMRRRTPKIGKEIEPFQNASFFVLILSYVLIKLFFLFLVAFFGLRFETYADEFLAVRALPLIFMQLSNHLGGMLITIQLILLLALFSDYKRYKRIIYTWLGAATVLAFAHLGSRTELFLLLLSAIIAYHRLVKPFSGRQVMLLGVVVLSTFLLFGLLRLMDISGGGGGSAQQNVSSGTEFDALFATTVDLSRRKDFNTIVPPPPTRLYNDFLALIPQQLLPIQKGDMAGWYLKSYYREVYDEGGGYAFGLIAETVIGYGWIELFIRAAILGVAFAAFHRWYARSRHTVWSLALYTWITAISYQAYRNTTFAPVVYFYFRFVPLYVLVWFFVPLFRGALGGRRSRAQRTPTPVNT